MSVRTQREDLYLTILSYAADKIMVERDPSYEPATRSLQKDPLLEARLNTYASREVRDHWKKIYTALTAIGVEQVLRPFDQVAIGSRREPQDIEKLLGDAEMAYQNLVAIVQSELGVR